jgi:hypothetical protein
MTSLKNHRDKMTKSTKLKNQRAKRRYIYRQWLKQNNVPSPIFQKISEAMLFSRLNYQTFIQDLQTQLAAFHKAQAEAIQATERAKETADEPTA